MIDDATGHDGGLGLPGWFTRGDEAAGFVGRRRPKTAVPEHRAGSNIMIARRRPTSCCRISRTPDKPFVLLFWSRDPDITQHNASDSIGKLSPGINGPTGMAGTRDADATLGALLAALKAQGLDKTTDVFVTADHGFTTIAMPAPPALRRSSMPTRRWRPAVRLSGARSRRLRWACRCRSGDA